MISGFRGPNRFLSNFYPAEFLYGEWICKTAEHAYQASKARFSLDAEEIISARSPGHAKRLARQIVLRPDWLSERENIMLSILRVKFTPGSLPANLLLETGEARLVETNTWGDTFWGVCNGYGKNTLGILLTQIRDEIRGTLG